MANGTFNTFAQALQGVHNSGHVWVGGSMGAVPTAMLTLKTHHVEPLQLPTVDPSFVRDTWELLQMSRQVFAFKIGVNARTPERWEQGPEQTERAGVGANSQS